MSGVSFCCHTNSTLFTDCCGVAICDDQSRCPKCGEEVPYSRVERWDMAMTRIYGKDKLAEMRDKWRKRA